MARELTWGTPRRSPHYQPPRRDRLFALALLAAVVLAGGFFAAQAVGRRAARAELRPRGAHRGAGRREGRRGLGDLHALPRAGPRAARFPSDQLRGALRRMPRARQGAPPRPGDPRGLACAAAAARPHGLRGGARRAARAGPTAAAAA